VVGLGNPGERYRRSRHNVGFMTVDAIAARAGVRLGREEDESWVAEARMADEPVLLVKPLTFMNRSGAAVGRLVERHAAGARDVVVIVDDWALDLGRLRIRERGSHGGHNGLRSVMETLGTDEFPRVRCGIRTGQMPEEDLADYVLAPFPPEDVLVVQEMVGTAADAVECLVREGVTPAMNRFNAPSRGAS